MIESLQPLSAVRIERLGVSLLLLHNKSQNLYFRTVITWASHLDRAQGWWLLLLSDVWGFSWKLQSLTEPGRSLSRWRSLHLAITIGLLDCPLDGGPGFPRTIDSRGRAGSEDALSDLILEVADSYFWNLYWSHVLTMIQWKRGIAPTMCILGGRCH